MLAAWYERNGSPQDVLTVGDMPAVEPAPGEVRVRIHTSGVNPSDVKSRRGRPLAGPRVIPHSDGAGVIDAVGKDVGHGRIGERVWLWNAQWKRPFGTAAEYCNLPAQQAAHLPENASFATGACFGIPAMTALHAIQLLGPIEGRTLLITGGGSSVGYYATQIAKLRGARVIATASARRAELARQAGADFVIDYQQKDVTKVAKDLTRGIGVDGIIDMDLSSTVRLINEAVMAPHSTAVFYGSNVAADIGLSFPTMLWNSYGLKSFVVYELKPEDRKTGVTELNKLIAENALRHAVGERFSLRDIAKAHEAVEQGNGIGNVVIDVA